MLQTATPRELNGISLYTKTGRPKSHFSDQERLRILGATEDDLDAFIALFCPDRPHFAITRAKSDDPRNWTTPRYRLSMRDVMNHLLGNRLPTKNPRWVAPRCWEVTRWVGIDVDYRNGQKRDFIRRCRMLRKVLRMLGISGKHLRVDCTPSGGKHYRFFLTHPIRVLEIEHLFRLVGIEECPGKFELFPRQTKGIRLPFGYLPDREFRDKAWLDFIRKYQQGEIPLVNWKSLRRKAEKYAKLHGLFGVGSKRAGQPASTTNVPSSRTTPSNNGRAVPMLGIPRQKRAQRAAVADATLVEYQRLLGMPPGQFTSADAERIWQLGICEPGTRVEVTKKLAWHLLYVRHLPRETAEKQLTEWIYQTGARTSEDVKQDMRQHTRRVEKQTRQIVVWTAAHPPTRQNASNNPAKYSREEVEYLHQFTQRAPADLKSSLLCFALNFLRYAKLHGMATPEGWVACIAAAGIMRKWPGCSGSQYKKNRDFLESAGLIVMAEREWKTKHGGGRARAYLIQVQAKLSTGADLGTDEALHYAKSLDCQGETTRNGCFCTSASNDSYKRVATETQRTSKMAVEIGEGENERGRLPSGKREQEDPALKQPLPREEKEVPAAPPLIIDPSDLQVLKERGLSEKAVKFFSVTRVQMGIPKAFIRDLERIQNWIPDEMVRVHTLIFLHGRRDNHARTGRYQASTKLGLPPPAS